MSTLARWTAAVGGVVAVAATAAPAHASFLQEVGSPFRVDTAPYGVLAADFSGDGLPDLVALNGSGSSITTILRRPTGSFQVEGPTGVVGGPSGGAVADFNRDGRPDVAVSGYAAPGGVSVHLRVPNGFMSANGSPYPVAKAGAVAVANFNGDEYLDIVASRYDTGGLTVLLGQANGSFVAEGNAPSTGAGPRSLAVGDFNHDGRPDVAVTNRGSDTVTVLLRRAPTAPTAPGFDPAPGSPFAVGDEPIGIVATDFNGDNQLDLAAGNYGSDTVSVLVGQGNGGFAPLSGSPFAAGDGASGVTSADFNGDDAPDLAVSNYGASTVSVLLRTATGFAPEPGSPYPTGQQPGQLATADFNGDKKADLAIPNSGDNTVTVLLNTTPDPTPPPGPGPGPGPGPTPPPPAPSINARLVLTWTITKRDVRLNSATLHDLPAGGATVKLACKPCKVSQTLTAKKATLSLRKLVNKRLKRGTTFTVAITKPGWNGLTFTRTVKQYGRTRKALRKAVKAPFSEKRKCVPLTAGAKC